MKCPSLKDYVKNASTEGGEEPAMKGKYRGTPLDAEMYARRRGSTKVLTAGKNK